jgi:predicted DNA-binding transcriptional regulator YafY
VLPGGAATAAGRQNPRVGQNRTQADLFLAYTGGVDRDERWETLVAYLRGRRHATMTEMAAELGVSVRTVRRDVAALRRRGLEIEGDRGRGGGVRFARFAPLPPLRLEEAEAVALWLSAQVARRAAGLPFSRDANAAFHKILAALPEARRPALRRLAERIVVGRPASPALRASAGEAVPALLEVFERCFREGVCLGFEYRDRKGITTQRQVEPHGLFVEVPIWYVLAVDVDKQARRTFRMDRIARPHALARRFTPSREVIDATVAEIPPELLGAGAPRR